jgi:hypothetical protein
LTGGGEAARGGVRRRSVRPQRRQRSADRHRSADGRDAG